MTVHELEREQVVEYARKFFADTSKNAPDREAVVAAVGTWYECVGLSAPKVVWCEHPAQFTSFPWMFEVFLNNGDHRWQQTALGLIKKSLEWDETALAVLSRFCELHDANFDGLTSLGFILSPQIDVELNKVLMPHLYQRAFQAFGEELSGISMAIRMECRRHLDRLRSVFEMVGSNRSLDLASYNEAFHYYYGKDWNTADGFATPTPLLRRRAIAAGSNAWMLWQSQTALIYDFLHEVDSDGLCLEDDLACLLKATGQLFRNACGHMFFQNVCFVCCYPEMELLDEAGRLHNPNGAAIEFRNGQKLYFWHGTSVPQKIIEQPESYINVSSIQHQANIEIRRVMLERFGIDRFVRESGADIIDESRFGTLYIMHFRDDEPLTVVAVTNSTSEPNGTFRRYFLRVPPTMKTAREAVGWTFGLESDDYDPVVES